MTEGRLHQEEIISAKVSDKEQKKED